MFHHFLQVVLHEVYAGLFQLLKLLQIRTVFRMKLLDTLISVFNCLLVALRCNLSLVLDSYPTLTDLLNLRSRQVTLLMIQHCLLYSLLLLNGLLFQAKELLFGILLHGQGISIAGPDLVAL